MKIRAIRFGGVRHANPADQSVQRRPLLGSMSGFKMLNMLAIAGILN
jgi:hypothetical protein